MTITTFGPVDARSLHQLETCMAAGDATLGVLCADHHLGYSQPIGGAVAYEGHISPSGVGYDIGCGNKAVQTELTRCDLQALGGVEAVMDEIVRRVPFGMGVPARERVEHPVLEQIRQASFAPQRRLARLAAEQLGTVGSGNHYVNVMEDAHGHVWVGVHFGSRGFGHKTAAGFLALAQGLTFAAHARDGEMDSPPVLFEADSELGRSYIAAMQLAGDYASAGRDVVVSKVLEVLGATAVDEVHNHHNYAWREAHTGRAVWVIRKGCTPAWPGQRGFVGGSMGEPSVILEGIDSDEAVSSFARRCMAPGG
jgi:tRNA-splicing ligase RtcB (3'-phosphate/5'-hydroxy nucleic acid ligase)